MDVNQTIATVMTREVASVDFDDTIEDVERALKDSGHSFVPVVSSQGGCFGVISASDLVAFHARKENSRLKRAWEVCTHQVVEVAPDTTIRKAACLMLDKHVHHVVVMEQGRLVGVLSSLDLIGHFMDGGAAC